VCSPPLWNPCGYMEINTSAAALFHDVGDPSTVKPFAAALSDLARRGVVRSPMPASGPRAGWNVDYPHCIFPGWPRSPTHACLKSR
jgi:hypothetical protein